MAIYIYKGDDTNAFGQNFLQINFTVPDGYTVSKAEFRCGSIIKTFENPVAPIIINLSAEETSKLDYQNICYLAVYDENGLKQTCEGSLTINTKNEVI